MSVGPTGHAADRGSDHLVQLGAQLKRGGCTEGRNIWVSWSGEGEADGQSGEVHAIFNNLTVAERHAEWRGEFLRPVLDITMCLQRAEERLEQSRSLRKYLLLALYGSFFLRTFAARCADKAASAKYQYLNKQ